MKKDDVKVDGTYAMKVGAEVVSVRIIDEKWKGNSLDGWVGVHLKTNHSVRIKTAQKLRAEVGAEAGDAVHEGTVVRGDGTRVRVTVPGDDKANHDPASAAPATGTPDAPAGDPAPQTPTTGEKKPKGRKHKSGITVVGDEPREGQAEAPADAPPATGKKAKAPKAPKEPKVKKVSALDAAAQVLAAAGKPMNAKEMIAEMAAQNLWTSPAARRQRPRSTRRSSARSAPRARTPGSARPNAGCSRPQGRGPDRGQRREQHGRTRGRLPSLRPARRGRAGLAR